MRVVNFRYKPHAELGQSDAEWDALKAEITAFMDMRVGDATVDLDAVRAINPKLRDDRLWRQIASDMNLIIVPD